MRRHWTLMIGMLLAAQAVVAENRALEEWREPVTGMRFIELPKACYLMGTKSRVPPKVDSFWEPLGFRGSLSDDETPAHEVCVDAFFMGKFEVRWGEWRQLMSGEANGKANDAPVANVSWLQVQEYIRRLGAASRGKHQFRLPTEAEWEYACRAGEKDQHQPWADQLGSKAWHNAPGMRPPEPQPVGKLAANTFGLHDMLGNVWEWVADDYVESAYQRHRLYNPTLSEGVPVVVIRGGSHRTEREQTRCGKRGKYPRAERMPQIGFRLVRIR